MGPLSQPISVALVEEPQATFMKTSSCTNPIGTWTQGIASWGKHATWNAFRQIRLQWMNSQHLVITLHEETHPAYRENNTEKIRSKDGVTIDYILLSPEKAE